ncbi:Ribosomal RNA large subunit methyltransferase E [Trichoplax sp. H2]|uniref:rRNA methyltransferase 2, mitochondrial n=1 Tax=Trichoplax adhaerens TaxID=10228 RepID=B3RPL8_TRIAD|nr:hypothetical protein TRIADDRAFT_53586 [Trichoplax adhaerens]EDV28212.1 hypothetical protein TRIADDRAFT_53586 [Trichoplax adhaerens]RDD45359.1 Ribosomal RNA large subunit methyltransferase E [Trichoplax sp. H2]|eukprot:XP_002110046.1 hypothetical protein TRIADDRAFT_53586 [Trichoplax adhaerens]
MNVMQQGIRASITQLIDLTCWNKWNYQGRRAILSARFYARGRKSSSSRWLRRQRDDPYVKKAMELGYRSRSAFKLLEMDKKFKIFKKGDIVIDIGASPGSWTQVALDKTGKRGLVMAVDIRGMKSVGEAMIFDHMDFGVPSTHTFIQNMLVNSKADVIMSDMSPNVAGSPKFDHQAIMTQALCALKFTFANLVYNGTFICKMFHGSDEGLFKDMLKQNYHRINEFKPAASRSESNEFYYICRHRKYYRKPSKEERENADLIWQYPI